ncbi:hypothetical protein ACQYRI_09475 [Salmonella enterica]
MNLEIFNFRLKKTIYDGDENGFYNLSSEIKFTKNGKVSFENSTAIPIWDVEDELVQIIISSVSRPVLVPHDKKPSYRHDNLDIYIYKSNILNESIIVIVAAGESQPARYKIKAMGVIKIIDF